METGICSHMREHTESNVDSFIPETGDKGESVDVNADNLTAGGANEFAIEREAVFSLGIIDPSAFVPHCFRDCDGEETVIQRRLRRRFSIGVGASLHWIGLEREAPLHRLWRGGWR